MMQDPSAVSAKAGAVKSLMKMNAVLALPAGSAIVSIAHVNLHCQPYGSHDARYVRSGHGDADTEGKVRKVDITVIREHPKM